MGDMINLINPDLSLTHTHALFQMTIFSLKIIGAINISKRVPFSSIGEGKQPKLR